MNNDIQRIINLKNKEKKVQDFTNKFKKPDGKMNLRPIQSEIIYRAYKNSGLLALVGVGEGKTLASFLLPHVLAPNGTGTTLLIIPANMRSQCLKDWETYGEHFYLPQKVELRSYEEISTTPNLLKTINPDVIICDEVHKLKNRKSTRTKRLARFISSRFRIKNPVKFVGLSGTMTSTSIKDFAHIAIWALRENAPVPISYNTLERWANVLDRDGRASKACKASMKPLTIAFGGDERTAFKRRLISANGIVTSLRGRPNASLTIYERKSKVPKKIIELISNVNETWQTPSGDELSSAMEKVRVLRQLICGFYYFWNWPNGKADKEWLEARSKWNKEVRKYLSRAPEGKDTPALVRNAVVRHLTGQAKEQLPNSLLRAFTEWLPQSKKDMPPVGVQWVSDYLIKDVIDWVSQQKDPPVIWYEHVAFASRLGRITGFPVFGQGRQADRLLLSIDKPIPAILSARAHSQGKNLQVWGNQIIANPLSDGARFEQLLGRMHRTGQQRKNVTATIYTHRVFASAISQARLSARYVEETTEQEQRLQYAKIIKP